MYKMGYEIIYEMFVVWKKCDDTWSGVPRSHGGFGKKAQL
jgi:hypothetical protein